MRWANSRTSLLCDFEMASLPASTSTVFAVTTMAAICGSVGPSACAAAAARPRLIAIANPIFFMRVLLMWNHTQLPVRAKAHSGCTLFALLALDAAPAPGVPGAGAPTRGRWPGLGDAPGPPPRPDRSARHRSGRHPPWPDQAREPATRAAVTGHGTGASGRSLP